MKYQLGLKLGSKDTQYTDEILQYYEQGIFQYILAVLFMFFVFMFSWGIEHEHSQSENCRSCKHSPCNFQIISKESHCCHDYRSVNSEYQITP